MKNRTIIIILIMMSIICIGVGVLMKDFGSSSKKTEIKEDPKPIVVDTPELYGAEVTIDDFEFNDISVTKIGKSYDVFVSGINNGERVSEIKQLNLILYDSKGKELSKLYAELIDIEAQEEFQFILSTSDDISTTADFKVEFIN